jgi:UDP-glucose 4-epimerase
LSKLGENHQAEGRVFNIGSDEEVTINELAEVVRDVVGSNSPVVHRSYKEVYGQEFEDMARRVPDLSRIRDLIGYAPTKTLRQIVENVANHLQAAHASHIPHVQQDQIGAAASAD